MLGQCKTQSQHGDHTSSSHRQVWHTVCRFIVFRPLVTTMVNIKVIAQTPSWVNQIRERQQWLELTSRAEDREVGHYAMHLKPLFSLLMLVFESVWWHCITLFLNYRLVFSVSACSHGKMAQNGNFRVKRSNLGGYPVDSSNSQFNLWLWILSLTRHSHLSNHCQVGRIVTFLVLGD